MMSFSATARRRLTAATPRLLRLPVPLLLVLLLTLLQASLVSAQGGGFFQQFFSQQGGGEAREQEVPASGDSQWWNARVQAGE